MDDGGPAYPGPALRQVHSINGSPQDDLPGHPGMSMLDAAALAALAGIVSRGVISDAVWSASHAFTQADAFIAERERRRKTP